ncbi:MAG: hypothetical protein GY793_05090 [Proteobacteria bacterium]|nr:hypothetical protein [Pseudomonadota bacterium]
MQIAIVGAAGNLGQDVIDQLSQLERKDLVIKGFDVVEQEDELVDSSYEEIISIDAIDENSFNDIDMVILAISAENTEKYVRLATASKSIVIDASGQSLSEKNPLVLYSQNIDDSRAKSKVVVTPNPLVQQLVSLLAPLDKSTGIKRVVTSTYQSVSGRGKDAIAELFDQSVALLSGQEHSEIVTFSTQIGFNCVPATSEFINEHSKEELQLMTQSQILMNKQIPITATCVQIPTFIGYAQSVSVEFNDSMDSVKVRNILNNIENVSVVDDPKNDAYATPYGCAETSIIYVSRIRNDYSNPNTVNFWVVSDNLKMSALNIANIVKHLSCH